MNKEKVFIKGYEVGSRIDTLGTREKIIQLVSGETVSIDENFIYKSIEREKVTIPQFVADWIEYCKRHNFTLFGCLDPVDGFERSVDENFEGDARKCIRWCRSASDKLARAWLDGYDIQGTKYVVTDGNHLYFKNYQEDIEIVILVDEQPGTMEYVKKFDTKEEAQKAADILGWKVQEVE